MKITVELTEEMMKNFDHIRKSFTDDACPSIEGLVEMYIEDGQNNTLDNLHEQGEEDGLSEYGLNNN